MSTNVGIDLHFKDDQVIAAWQQQINLSKQLVENVKQLQINLNASTNKLSTQLDGLSKNTAKVNKSFGSLSNAFNSAAIVAAVAVVASKITDIGIKAVQTAAKFEKFSTILTNTLGSSSKAKAALDGIVDFASKTPFAVDELTESFIKFANRGINLTAKEMTKLGDLAASQGKSFDQLTEAVLDAQTGEFERLKEFGIRASAAGDQVTFAFKGQTVVVEKNSEAINRAILGFGELKGVAGGMAAISQTLTGTLSNLDDSLDQVYKLLGDKLSPAVKLAAGTVSDLLTAFKNLLNSESDQIKASGDLIKTSKIEAKNGQELLDRYDALNAKGVKPTTKSKEELRSVTFQLKQAFGESIGKINEETGAFEINTQAIRDSIKERLLIADQEALSLANKVLAAKENKKILQQQTLDAKAALGEQQKILKDANISPDVNQKTVSGGDFRSERLGKAPAYLEKNVKGFQDATIAINSAQLQIAKADKTIIEGLETLKESGFSEKDVDKLIANVTDVKTAVGSPPPSGDKFKKAIEDLTKALADLDDQVAKSQIANEKDPRVRAQLEYDANLLQIQDTENKLEALKKKTRSTADISKQIEALRTFATAEYNKTIAEISLNEAKVAAEIRKAKSDQEKEQLDDLKKGDAEVEKVRQEGINKQIDALKENLEVEKANLEQATAEKEIIVDKDLINNKISKKKAAIALLEIQKEGYEKELQLLIEFKKAEAALKGEVYDPKLDPQAAGINTKIFKIKYEISKEDAQKSGGIIRGFIQDALDLNDEDFKQVEDAFRNMAAVAVKSWQEATQAQIDANKELQDSLEKRRENAQQGLENEIELEKLGYASNVEAKRQELSDIAAQEKTAKIEGIRLKKQAARQELILSELSSAAALTEAVAKTFSSNAGYPGGIIISAVIIAGMLATFAAYKSKIRAAESSVALYTGGRPVDFLQSGQSPHRDAPGRGKGHKIEGTKLRMGAYEMILNEPATNANLPFWKMANTGAFNNIDLMDAILHNPNQLPDIRQEVNKLTVISDNKEAYERRVDNSKVEAAIKTLGLQLINYFDNRPEYVSHEGKIIEFTKNLTHSKG